MVIIRYAQHPLKKRDWDTDTSLAQKEGEEKTWGRRICKLRRKASEEVSLADMFILNF